MSQFLTGKDLDNKLTDIIWNAKKELIILSPARARIPSRS